MKQLKRRYHAVFQVVAVCLGILFCFTASACRMKDGPSDSSGAKTKSKSPLQQTEYAPETHPAEYVSETQQTEPAPETQMFPVSEQPAIKLSAGVALPQTGPNGTLMSFSVDYQFSAGGPNADVKYAWVIERSGGKSHAQPVQMKNRGTLQILIQGWRPTEGPFKSHIAVVSKDKTLTKISGSIRMD